MSHYTIKHKTFLAGLLLAAFCPLVFSCSAPLEYHERIVAGGPSDFMEVRHIVLRGSNYEIGKKLAELAESHHNSGPLPSANRADTEAQRQYFQENYPAFYERMRGVANAAEKDLEDNKWNFASLPYRSPTAGCTVVFYPPNTTEEGRGIMSRNFDFTTGTLNFFEQDEDVPPVCSRPYVIELYPDTGYSSLVVCCFDLLGGACDGINSEGLTVALLADGSRGSIMDQKANPSPGPRAGFNEIQIVRYLLDTCADIEDAKAALQKAELYFRLIPCHYIIADRQGRSFIWENSLTMDRGHIIEGGDEPLVTTNFLQHLNSDPGKYPVEGNPLGSFNRHRGIKSKISDNSGKMDRSFIRDTNKSVSLTHATQLDHTVTSRTLWHALYFPEELRMEIDFYLGEEPGQTESGVAPIRRSEYMTFTLVP